MSMSPLTADIWSRLAWPPASSTRAVVPSAKMSNPTSRYRLFSSSDMSSKRVINYVSSSFRIQTSGLSLISSYIFDTIKSWESEFEYRFRARMRSKLRHYLTRQGENVLASQSSRHPPVCSRHPGNNSTHVADGQL